MFEISTNLWLSYPTFRLYLKPHHYWHVWPFLQALLPIIALIINNILYFLLSFTIYKALKSLKYSVALTSTALLRLIILRSTLLQPERKVHDTWPHVRDDP